MSKSTSLYQQSLLEVTLVVHSDCECTRTALLLRAVSGCYLFTEFGDQRFYHFYVTSPSIRFSPQMSDALRHRGIEAWLEDSNGAPIPLTQAVDNLSNNISTWVHIEPRKCYTLRWRTFADFTRWAKFSYKMAFSMSILQSFALLNSSWTLGGDLLSQKLPRDC